MKTIAEWLMELPYTGRMTPSQAARPVLEAVRAEALEEAAKERARAEAAEAELQRWRTATYSATPEHLSQSVADGVIELVETKFRAEAAEDAFLACAQAIGVSYEAEGHNSAPGPLDEVVKHILDAVRAKGELIDADVAREAAEKRAAELEEYAQHRDGCELPPEDRSHPGDCTCGLSALLALERGKR